MKRDTKEKLNSMKMTDVYSLIMFALFKLREVPEYASLSELAYILDGKHLFNFLEYFGGTTIKIPTLAEFKVVIESLLLYQYVNIEHIEYNQAIKLLDITEDISIKDVKNCYAKLVDILNTYEFNRS